MNELVKKVGLINISVTIATKWWHHDFCISAIFSTSRPKLLKRFIVSYSLGVDLQDCKVWENSMRTFSKKIALKFFPVKNYRFTLFSVSLVPVLSWQTETMFSPYIVKILFLVQWQLTLGFHNCIKNRIFTIPLAPAKRSKQAWQTCWSQSTQICRIQTKEKLLK